MTDFPKNCVSGLLIPLVIAVVANGCQSKQPAPPIDRLEDKLSIMVPKDATIVGGREMESEPPDYSALWLITSEQPLPLPPGHQPVRSRRRSGNRPAGTRFRVSALANLLAASDVQPDQFTGFKGGEGVMHNGVKETWRYCYREAMTNGGWLTAVEVQAVQGAD